MSDDFTGNPDNGHIRSEDIIDYDGTRSNFYPVGYPYSSKYLGALTDVDIVSDYRRCLRIGP